MSGPGFILHFRFIFLFVILNPFTLFLPGYSIFLDISLEYLA